MNLAFLPQLPIVLLVGISMLFMSLILPSSKLVQCSKAREQNFQFWKLLAVVVGTHIKCVDKVHKRN